MGWRMDWRALSLDESATEGSTARGAERPLAGDLDTGHRGRVCTSVWRQVQSTQAGNELPKQTEQSHGQVEREFAKSNDSEDTTGEMATDATAPSRHQVQ
jgi:hypothetical protein